LETDNFTMYKDFAHSPSKLKATTTAFKTQFPDRKMTACMELHTFSSLNLTFLQEYAGSMDLADQAIVYFNPHTIAHKKLAEISKQDVQDAFKSENLLVLTDKEALVSFLKKQDWNNHNLLMMSSGNFDGLSFENLGQELINQD
jgi:UDP-N-acetylmuramate: L-alanyl-gamma-D-glutamyl-meso-diaminopimelate ligase